jgi:hypothetical protein
LPLGVRQLSICIISRYTQLCSGPIDSKQSQNERENRDEQSIASYHHYEK